MKGASIATALKRNAAPTPMEISVNIFNSNVTMERQPRCKSGHPAPMTTSAVSANCTQREKLLSTQGCLASAGTKWTIARTNTGNANAAAHQKRLVMSRSSAVSSSSVPAVTVFRSSVMPHLGHSPGWFCWTSGCIGQV